MLKFSIQNTLTGLTNQTEVFQMAKDIGFDGVELNLFQQTLEPKLVTELRKAIDSTGMPLSAICGGYRHWIGHFEEVKRLQAVTDIRKTMEFAAKLDVQGIIAPAAWGMFSKSLPPAAPPRDEQGDRKALLDSLFQLAEQAEKLQVKLFLEPLNRYEDHMIHTVAQAVSLLKEVGSPKLKVLGDFFHMNIEEADLSETIESYFGSLGYFHLADSNRQLPGKAHLDFVTPFQTLKRLKYAGYLAMECRIGDNRRELLQEALQFLRRCLNT